MCGMDVVLPQSNIEAIWFSILRTSKCWNIWNNKDQKKTQNPTHLQSKSKFQQNLSFRPWARRPVCLRTRATGNFGNFWEESFQGQHVDSTQLRELRHCEALFWWNMSMTETQVVPYSFQAFKHSLVIGQQSTVIMSSYWHSDTHSSSSPTFQDTAGGTPLPPAPSSRMFATDTVIPFPLQPYKNQHGQGATWASSKYHTSRTQNLKGNLPRCKRVLLMFSLPILRQVWRRK